MSVKHTCYWVTKDAEGNPLAVSVKFAEARTHMPEGGDIVPVVECQTHLGYRLARVAVVVIALMFAASMLGGVLILLAVLYGPR